ncbi:hypothetical protein [Flavobacterium phage FL-1]|nr:hypothetical protein [Flavobacterium phage FL-1]
MRSLINRSDVDKSDLVNYPSARIRNNNGSGNGTAVNEATKGDFHQMLEKLMRLYGIVPNELPDNTTNGYQLIDALRALASKNDFIYPLTTDGSVLNLDLKLDLLLENEFVVCLASANKTVETTIKGSTGAIFSITYSGNFKANEYVRVIKTNTGISIIRVADWNSLDAMASELLYLKKASQAQENAGTIDTAATTPLVNKVTFTRRVIGVDSSDYLASSSNNGLMSIAQFNQLASLTNNVKNVGWFSGLNIGSTPGALPVSGNVTAAVMSVPNIRNSIVLVTLQNAMTNTNYFVRSFIEGQSTNLDDDNDLGIPVFKVVSTTQFQLGFREIDTNEQNLKVHIEVVQL